MEHKIATTHKFNDEKKPRGRLKTGMKANQKWMVGRCFKHVFFGLYPVNILIISDQLLLDDLHCVYAFGILEFNHEHLGIASTANDTNEVKVGQRNGLSVGLTRGRACRRLNWRHFIVFIKYLRHRSYSRTQEIRSTTTSTIGRQTLLSQLSDLTCITCDFNEFVTLFVDQQFALCTFEALTPQAPNSVMAVGTESTPIEPFCLENVAVDFVNLSPSASPTAVYTPIFSLTWHPRRNG